MLWVDKKANKQLLFWSRFDNVEVADLLVGKLKQYMRDNDVTHMTIEPSSALTRVAYGKGLFPITIYILIKNEVTFKYILRQRIKYILIHHSLSPWY